MSVTHHNFEVYRVFRQYTMDTLEVVVRLVPCQVTYSVRKRAR